MQVEKKLGIKEFLLGNHMRSSDQYRSIQTVFKNMNSGYLTFKEKYEAKKTIELRSLLYNALFKSP